MDAVNGPPPASSVDVATLTRRLANGPTFTPLKEKTRVSVGETNPVESENSMESKAMLDSPSGSVSVETPKVDAKADRGLFSTPDQGDEKTPARSATPKGKKSTPRTLDDLVDTAVARANGFSAEQVAAFSNALSSKQWCAVDRLSGDQVRVVTQPSPCARCICSPPQKNSSPKPIVAFRFSGCGHTTFRGLESRSDLIWRIFIRRLGVAVFCRLVSWHSDAFCIFWIAPVCKAC